jgi:hypothetical protein
MVAREVSAFGATQQETFKTKTQDVNLDEVQSEVAGEGEDENRQDDEVFKQRRE